MDDVKYASLLQTPLTTIHQPCQDLGATALFAMLNRIANPAAPARDLLLDFQLVVRKSTDANANAQLEAKAVYHGRRSRLAATAAAEASARPASLPDGLQSA